MGRRRNTAEALIQQPVTVPPRDVTPFIPVYKPYLSGREKEYVNQCLDSTWISSKGEFIGRFERDFARYIAANHATTVCNGTVALHLALKALGVGPGDEVIVPTLTYIASVNSILHAGAVPIFADSLESTWQIDPDDVRRKISPRTKAVMAVHLYGGSCDMDSLTAICGERGLLLIEDCAEAIGTFWRGRHVGTFGDAATFSFFGNKTITTGEGGIVVSKTSETHQLAFHIKTQGVSPDREYWHDVVGYNYRMTNICAAIGVAQLEHIDQILGKKREIACWYSDALVGLPVTMQEPGDHVTHSYWMNCLAVDDARHKLLLRKHLGECSIETRPLFLPAHSMPHCRYEGSFPIAERLSECGLNLPSYPALSKHDVEFIASTIRRYFSAATE